MQFSLNVFVKFWCQRHLRNVTHTQALLGKKKKEIKIVIKIFTLFFFFKLGKKPLNAL